MIEVKEMASDEIVGFLDGQHFGHFGCVRGNVPYVVPISYAYIAPAIYVYTTEGKKTDILDENPEVCLQVDKINNNHSWKSVIVNGRATRVRDGVERERALSAILEENPTLTPAVSIRWMDDWVKENREVIYRIEPYLMTGRRTGGHEEKLFVGSSRGRSGLAVN